MLVLPLAEFQISPSPPPSSPSPPPHEKKGVINADFVLVMQAITMHMVSYAGRADMQIQVAKDVIPDPHVLSKCFKDALLEMKEAAEPASKTKRDSPK